jgi:hypothetical protein
MKRTKPRLKLAREVIRALEGHRLAAVAAGEDVRDTRPVQCPGAIVVDVDRDPEA